MSHQAQTGLRGIFVGIPKHKKRYMVYVPSTRNIISSYDVVFDGRFSSVLAYTSHPYSESMNIYPHVTYTPCAMPSRKKTGNIITFTQFEESDVLTKTRSNAESGDESEDDSIMPPLLS